MKKTILAALLLLSISIPARAQCIMAPPQIDGPSAMQTIPGRSTQISIAFRNMNSESCGQSVFLAQFYFANGWVSTLPTTQTAPVNSQATYTYLFAISSGVLGPAPYAVRVAQMGTENASVFLGLITNAPPINMTLATDKKDYRKNQPVTIQTYLTVNGSGVAGLQVSFVVSTPNGQGLHQPTVTTDTTGKASVIFHIPNDQSATGSYDVTGLVMRAGQPVQLASIVTTAFSVK